MRARLLTARKSTKRGFVERPAMMFAVGLVELDRHEVQVVLPYSKRPPCSQC